MAGSPAISTIVTRICNWGNFYTEEEQAAYEPQPLPSLQPTGIGFRSASSTSDAYNLYSGGLAHTQYRGTTYNSIRITADSNGGRGGFVIDPEHLKDQLLNLHKNNLVARFDGFVNTFTLRPGREASSGFFLVYKETLDEIAKNGSKSNSPNDYDLSLWEGEYRFQDPTHTSSIDDIYELTITFSNKKDTKAKGHNFTSEIDTDVVIDGVWILQAIAITPSRMDSFFLENELANIDDHNKQVYLIEVADPRAWASMAGINRSYNVRTLNPDPFNQQVDLHQVTTNNRRLGYNANIDVQTSPGTIESDTGWRAKYHLHTILAFQDGKTRPWSWTALIYDLWAKSIGTVWGDSVWGNLNFDDAEFPGEEKNVTFTVSGGAYGVGSDHPAPPGTNWHHPENFKFEGMSAWDAFWEVLDSISHSLVLLQPSQSERDIDAVEWKIVSSNKMNSAQHSPRNLMHKARLHLQDSYNTMALRDSRIPAWIDVVFPARRRNLYRQSTQDSNVAAGDRISGTLPLHSMDNQEQSPETYTIRYNCFSGNGALDGSFTESWNEELHASSSVTQGQETALIHSVRDINKAFHKYLPKRNETTPETTADLHGRSYTDSIYLYATGSSVNYPHNQGDPMMIYERKIANFNEYGGAGGSGGPHENQGKALNHDELAAYGRELAILHLAQRVHCNTPMYREYSSWWDFKATHKVSEITLGDVGNGAFTSLRAIPTTNKEYTARLSRKKNIETPPVNRFVWVILTSTKSDFSIVNSENPSEQILRPGDSGVCKILQGSDCMANSASQRTLTLQGLRHAAGTRNLPGTVKFFDKDTGPGGTSHSAGSGAGYLDTVGSGSGIPPSIEGGHIDVYNVSVPGFQESIDIRTLSDTDPYTYDNCIPPGAMGLAMWDPQIQRWTTIPSWWNRQIATQYLIKIHGTGSSSGGGMAEEDTSFNVEIQWPWDGWDPLGTGTVLSASNRFAFEADFAAYGLIQRGTSLGVAEQGWVITQVTCPE